MGLDWNIQRNGKDICSSDLTSWDKDLPCNGMILSSYLDGTTAHMVSDLGLSPYYPLWPAEMTPDSFSSKDTIDAEDMRVIAFLIAKRAECAEHLRIAAWLWSWAEQDEEGNHIALHMSY